MKIRESFVTNSSSASYVVNPSLMYNPDYKLEDVARDMLGVMDEDDSGDLDELSLRLGRINLRGDAGIRFPSCEYDTHIWFDDYEGQRKIIIHTCHNHPFDTIDYFQDIGYPEDGLGELYRKRSESQIFYDLAKDELVIGDEHYVVLCNSTTDFTVTLPSASRNTGRVFHIKNISTNIVTVDGSGSETIDDGLTAVIEQQYESIKIVSDGSNWHIL